MASYIKGIVKRGSFEFGGNCVMYIINSVDNVIWFRLSDICSAISLVNWCNPKHKNYLMGKGKLDSKRRILFTQSKVYAWGINEEDVVWLLEEYAEANSARAERASKLLKIVRKFIEREKGVEMKIVEKIDNNKTEESTNSQEVVGLPSIFSYNGNPITFKNADGTIMVNATQMAKSFGNTKRPQFWLNNQQTNEFLSAFSKARKIASADLVVVTKGGNNSGTWFHEDVAMEFARWLAPEFAIWCNDRIKELLTEGTTSVYGNVNFGGFPIPQKFPDALLLSAHLQQKVEEQEAKIEEDKPKVEYYTGMVENRDYFTTTTIATELRTTSQVLNQFLCNKGVLIGKSGSWKVTDEHQTLLSPSPFKSIIRWNHEGRTLIHQLWEERVEELVEA